MSRHVVSIACSISLRKNPVSSALDSVHDDLPSRPSKKRLLDPAKRVHVELQNRRPQRVLTLHPPRHQLDRATRHPQPPIPLPQIHHGQPRRDHTREQPGAPIRHARDRERLGAQKPEVIEQILGQVQGQVRVGVGLGPPEMNTQLVEARGQEAAHLLGQGGGGVKGSGPAVVEHVAVEVDGDGELGGEFEVGVARVRGGQGGVVEEAHGRVGAELDADQERGGEGVALVEGAGAFVVELAACPQDLAGGALGGCPEVPAWLTGAGVWWEARVEPADVVVGLDGDGEYEELGEDHAADLPWEG